MKDRLQLMAAASVRSTVFSDNSEAYEVTIDYKAVDSTRTASTGIHNVVAEKSAG